MSGLLTVKLGRDLRAAWPRFVLMVIAVAVSLTVFGAVLMAWAATGRETRGAYLSTEPASATIVLDQPVDAGRLAALAAEARQRPGVIAATARTQFDSDVQVNGRLRDYPLQVFVAAPDDPMRMATFEVRGASWPPAPGEIFIGGGALDLLDVAVGDTVTVTPPGGEPARLRVAATVYDPSLAPAIQEQRGRGYLSATALATPGGPARMDQLKLQVAEPGQEEPTRDRDTAVAVAADVARWLRQDQGLAVREVQVPEPYAHPHQWQADVFLGSLLGGGAAALLLSTVLVANMLNNLFTQQIPQIGIMKAVGAPSARIGRLYLAMTLLVALAATLLALAPAVALGRVGVDQFLGLLGILPVSLAAPWWTYLVVGAAGLGLPPLIALVPLVRASRTTVRAAIDHRGGRAAPSAATGVLARLGRLRLLDRGLLMALRNTVRRPARFWLSVGLLATAGVVFVAGMSLSSGMAAVDEEKQARRIWDVTVQLAGPAAAGEITGVVEGVPGVRRVEAWRRAQTGVAGPGQVPVTRTYPDQGHGSVALVAVPAGATLPPPPELVEGRWLNPGETGAVVLNFNVRDRSVPGTRTGDTVQLYVGGQPTDWRVVGISGEREGGVYTTVEGFAEATGGPVQANLLRVVTDGHDEATRTRVADAVAGTLTGAGIPVKSAESISRSEAVSREHLTPVIVILVGIALPLGVVGGIGLASTMSANILDRFREFGVLHAIGARPREVRRVVVAEGVFLALTSCLVAALPTLGLTAVLGTGLGNLFGNTPLPFRVSLLAVGIWVAVVILGAVLATEAAATRASRITVREALAYL